MRIKDRPEYKNKAKPMAMPADTSALMASQEMAARNYGSVLITNEEGTLEGIVTERDIMTRLVAAGRDPSQTTLADIMTRDLRTAEEDDNLLDWLRIMSNERFRHLPVVDEHGKVVNLLSQGDFVSYTWPELLDRVKETTKATFNANYQIFFIVLALLAYALLVGVLL